MGGSQKTVLSSMLTIDQKESLSKYIYLKLMQNKK